MEESNKVEDNVEIDKGRDMRTLKILIAMIIEKNVNNAIGANNACESTHEIMRQWTEEGMVIDIVDEK